MTAGDFWAPRRCCLQPIPEIFTAANLLNRAVDAHMTGNAGGAADLIRAADMPVLAAWTESLWGARHQDIHRYRPVDNLPPLLSGDQKTGNRMPGTDDCKKLVTRDGHHCRYCGIPVIREQIRNRLRKAYPAAARWGRGNKNQHAALQCLWLTYEHVVPHSRGGDNSLENMIISCQACNCAKMNYTLDELGLIDPRTQPVHRSSWDGLERFK